jgi:hypothetical protein
MQEMRSRMGIGITSKGGVNQDTTQGNLPGNLNNESGVLRQDHLSVVLLDTLIGVLSGFVPHNGWSTLQTGEVSKRSTCSSRGGGEHKENAEATFWIALAHFMCTFPHTWCATLGDNHYRGT